MLTPIKRISSRLQPGRAYRFSRGIAGGTAAFFFALGSIFKVPLQKFLFGYGAAASTLTLSAITFFFKAIDNYQNSDPEDVTRIKRLTTKLIIDQLHVDIKKTKDFLTKLNISESDIDRIEAWTEENNDDLHDVFYQIFNAVECDLRKYPASFLFAVITASTHFMECMLLQLYANLSSLSFDLNTVFTSGNIILGLIALMALSQAVMEFIDTKSSFEYPNVTKLCSTIFNAYTKHSISTQDSLQEQLEIVIGQQL